MSAEKFRHEPQTQQFFRLPKPPEDIFKTPKRLSEDFTIPQGEAVVIQGKTERHGITLIDITPELDEGTLTILNHRIGLEKTLSDRFKMRRELLEGFPSVRIAVDKGINFVFEGEIVGGVNKEKGFWVRKEEDDGEKPRKFLIYKTTTPDTSQDGLRFALELFRKQRTGIPTEDGNLLVLTHITFECDKGGFFELNDLIKEWIVNGQNPEDLNAVIKVKLKIEDKGSTKSDGDGNGESIATTSPITDGGGGKLNP